MPCPMTNNDSVYRPQQMTRLNVSNKTLLEIYRDMFIAPFDASGFRTPRPTWHALLIITSPEFIAVFLFMNTFVADFVICKAGHSNECASFDWLSGILAL